MAISGDNIVTCKFEDRTTIRSSVTVHFVSVVRPCDLDFRTQIGTAS